MNAVTFCTTEFEKYAQPWSENMAAHGMRPVVQRVRSTGNWARNTGLKPAAILAVWDKLDPVFLYTDIDAQVLSTPQVPEDEDWDIGIFDNPNPGHKNRTAAAAIFFRRNDKTQAFILAWAEQCRRSRSIDHPQLTYLLEAHRRSRRFSRCLLMDAGPWMKWSQNGLSTEKAPFSL